MLTKQSKFITEKAYHNSKTCIVYLIHKAMNFKNNYLCKIIFYNFQQ